MLGLLRYEAAAAADAPHADAPRGTIDASRALDAGAPPPVHLTASPPDPPPLREREQWVFDLRWNRGAVSLVATSKVEEAAAMPTPRVMGRFALELFEGPTLVERLRFDFPLLAVDDPDAGWESLPSFAPKLRTHIAITFPATSRGNRLELVDRETGRRWPLPWRARLSALVGDAAHVTKLTDAAAN
jgi:hypothetical protein